MLPGDFYPALLGEKCAAPDRRKRKNPKRGRPYRFDREHYTIRGAVERCFAWLKSFRKLVPRYERLERSFRGLVVVACTLIVGRISG